MSPTGIARASAARRTGGRITGFMLAVILTMPPPGAFAAEESFAIQLWPRGKVCYRFDDGTEGPQAVSLTHQRNVETEMRRWRDALKLLDPLTRQPRKSVEFERDPDCTRDGDGNVDVVVIRYHKPGE